MAAAYHNDNHKYKKQPTRSHPSTLILLTNEQNNNNDSSSSSSNTLDNAISNSQPITNRNSLLQQDVEEALNSLLWQPYEYQQCRRTGSPGTDTTSSSLSSDDSSCSGDTLYSSSEDAAAEETSEACRDDESSRLRAGKRGRCRRGGQRGRKRRRSRRNSRALDFVECVVGGTVVVASPSNHRSCCSGVHGNNNGCGGDVSGPSDSSSMQQLLDLTNPDNIIVNNGNGNGSTTLLQQQQQQERPDKEKEREQLFSLISSANVVGLPDNNPSRLLANHPRNGSEPALFRNLQVVPQQQRNLVVTHSRSSSVPNEGPNNVNVVNFVYRAVPVNVLSPMVPTIHCVNNNPNPNEGNNVSNVHIMPLGSSGTTSTSLNSSSSLTTQVTVHSSIVPQPRSTSTRTFTSTEAQTDDISVVVPQESSSSSSNNNNRDREQRRKDRRERRHQRRMNNHRHSGNVVTTADSGTQVNGTTVLPDLLNNHILPPPYVPTGTGNVATGPSDRTPVLPMLVPPPHPQQTILTGSNYSPSGSNLVPVPSFVTFQPAMGHHHGAHHHHQAAVPLVPQGGGGGVAVSVAMPPPPPSGFRFPFPSGGLRRGRFSEDPAPKGCCGLLSWKPGSLRWFIAVIALIAVCCVLVGTALGAMRPAGRDHLTVSLLMIGVGIVLVTVSGIAWRLTSHDSSTCRSMLGLGSTESVDVCSATRRFVPRLPPSYGRPHHPYAAMMYPEFQYRPPPPSYQASMQEYRLRLLLLDRGGSTPSQIQGALQNVVSPPPTYRSHAGSLLRAPLSNHRRDAVSEYSCPPSYRSQNSSNRPGGTLQGSILHSREQSLSADSNNGGNEQAIVNVVNILGGPEDDEITLDSLKMEPDGGPLRMLLGGGDNTTKGSSNDLDNMDNNDHHYHNLVTIVQTGDDQSPVILTVSGSSTIDSGGGGGTTEMEILAHL